MTLDEALELVAAGERVTSDSLSRGSVLKAEAHGWDAPRLMIVFEGAGASYEFQHSPADQAADWRLVEGWSSYG
jgi:hypothetical protein